jgi:hypothetical protein
MLGYSRLARMIGKRRELGIFRTFSSLEAQSLLYMQAELVQLEADMGAFASLREMQPSDQCFVGVGEKVDPNDAAIWKSRFADTREKLNVYCEIACRPFATKRS